MTDLVSQLVGALERLLNSDPDGAIATASEDDLTLAANDLKADPVIREQAASVLQARAALTAAKAGGWVAVPVEAARLAGVALSEHPGHSPLTDWEHAAMKACSLLAARPLPNPPKEQA